jgi:hypothetical protein
MSNAVGTEFRFDKEIDKLEAPDLGQHLGDDFYEADLEGGSIVNADDSAAQWNEAGYLESSHPTNPDYSYYWGFDPGPLDKNKKYTLVVDWERRVPGARLPNTYFNIYSIGVNHDYTESSWKYIADGSASVEGRDAGTAVVVFGSGVYAWDEVSADEPHFMFEAEKIRIKAVKIYEGDRSNVFSIAGEPVSFNGASLTMPPIRLGGQLLGNLVPVAYNEMPIVPPIINQIFTPPAVSTQDPPWAKIYATSVQIEVLGFYTLESYLYFNADLSNRVMQITMQVANDIHRQLVVPTSQGLVQASFPPMPMQRPDNVSISYKWVGLGGAPTTAVPITSSDIRFKRTHKLVTE